MNSDMRERYVVVLEPLTGTDGILALRARKPAEPEHQRRREGRFHVCLQ